MIQKPELLAPAGNLEKLKIAVLYGADAVYIGGEAFSLRTAADNFSLADIREGVNFAHRMDAKVYLALNVFLRNSDIDVVREYLQEVCRTGIDAVIVSDLGMFMLVREIAPTMEIHVSTQANTTNYISAQTWYKMGAKRVVLARELSIEEIKEISQKVSVGLELEMFVHGAMCVSYSGRCLLPSPAVGNTILLKKNAPASICRFMKMTGELLSLIQRICA